MPRLQRRLKEVTKLGKCLCFLDNETRNLWEADRPGKVSAH